MKMLIMKSLVFTICLISLSVHSSPLENQSTQFIQIKGISDVINIDGIEAEIEEFYNSVLDTIEWHNLDNLVNTRNFWELVGYEEYHDRAAVYDYVKYVNLHHDGLEANKEFQRPTLSEARTQALNASISVMDNQIFQNRASDVKFVSLSSIELEDLSANPWTNDDFEAVICVSGFLSQHDNLRESWHAVLDHSHGRPVFGFKWPAEDFVSISAKFILDIARIRDITTFNTVRAIAMDSGKLLAHALILEFPTYLPKVTLVSFSLGTQVIVSCLEELHRLGATGIIKHVYLLGGATTLREKDAKIFDTVSGSLNHVYTPSDRILDFYELSVGLPAIGQNVLNKKFEEKLNEMGIQVNQYDVTEISNGHIKYRKYLDSILEKVKF